jgi:predicted nucleic acid-binding protein
MRHVFVETNWLVGYAAPAHHKIPEAVELLNRAHAQEIRLYLPSFCISEARRPLQEKFQLRSTADRVRNFLRWARREGIINSSDEEATRRVLDQMESKTEADLDALGDIFEALRNNSYLEIFDLTQEMLEMGTQLSFLNLALNPFDQAVLAAVLVKANQITRTGAENVAFCELDSDLQPWDKTGRRKEALARLYDEACVWV